MFYKDLVQFEPLESIIQLREADQKDEARKLVETYVISERMADQLAHVILPQLNVDKPKDSRGLFIVGNYGTGKSHLMSVISAIAEHADLLDSLRQPQPVKHDVRKAAASVAGKFQVIRVEIGAVDRNLRDILCDELSAGLARLGVTYAFPAITAVNNNKDPLVAMMAAFDEQFESQGLLLVVDELLDFLRHRKDLDIVRDLGFLREVGEVCRLTKFRMIAGVQESLFESPRFQHVADSVRRVKDRFEQVRIAREDVAYVVAERLLRKTDRQRSLIREHLQKFTPLYGAMAEQLDEFVRLFPIHPAYLAVLEQVSVAEKRQALRNISILIRNRLEQRVLDDEPGLISYDSYWDFVTEDAALRGIPDVKEVMDKSRVLEDRVKAAFVRKALTPMALRIIHALSVHRLTKGDIHTPLGATSEELRDDLCLYTRMPEMDAEFLRTTVDAALQAIITTVSGQFISFNADNGQYYLDLKKDVDVDAQIAARADGLRGNELDRYYFEVLTALLELPSATYVSGHRIWQYEVEWRKRGITRPGYIFLGAPNERSTAQPPREFYLYFLQAFEVPEFDDTKAADEVFFRLVKRDATFDARLKQYAGAREMAISASGSNKKAYEDKAVAYRSALQTWLRENLAQCMELTYRGVPKSVAERAKGTRSNLSARETISAVAAACLKMGFDDALPEYPAFAFTNPITQATLREMATEAVQWLSSPTKTNPGAVVLEGLELKAEGSDKIVARESRYGKYFLGLLARKGEGQVVNRSEIMTGDPDTECDAHFRLEPAWVAVTLLALAHQGELSIALPGRKIDASNLEDAGRLRIDDLCQFKHIERPKGLPVNALQALCELLGLPTGLVNVNGPGDQDNLVQKVAVAAKERLNQAITAQQHLQRGLPCWNAAVLEGAGKADLAQVIDPYKQFLESLQPYNTFGKLKNFRHTVADIQAVQPGKAAVAEVIDLSATVSAIQPLTAYLSTAYSVLATDDPLRLKIKSLEEKQLALLRDPQQRRAPTLRTSLVKELEALKREYVARYIELHRRARLSVGEDKRKSQLVSDPRLSQLNTLRQIDFMPVQQLDELHRKLDRIQSCNTIGEADLRNATVCPTCSYRPVEDAMPLSAQKQLEQVETELEQVHADWLRALQSNLEDPTVHENFNSLKSKQRKLVEQFLRDAAFPEHITAEFVGAVNDTLRGLVRVAFTSRQITRALTEGGMPCDVRELKARFDSFVESQLQGKDQSRARIVIEGEAGGRE